MVLEVSRELGEVVLWVDSGGITMKQEDVKLMKQADEKFGEFFCDSFLFLASMGRMIVNFFPEDKKVKKGIVKLERRANGQSKEIKKKWAKLIDNKYGPIT